MSIYRTNRTFRLWRYLPSHSTMLLRSNKSENEYGIDSTIDIDFTDVKYVELPCVLTGLSLREAVEIPPKIQKLKKDDKVFELTSGSQIFYIIAWKCVVGKSNMEYDETIYSSKSNSYDEIIVQF